MLNTKFKLTDEKKTMEDGTEVYRIEALKDFRDVKVGYLGGFVESEDNLSFEENDTSWVYDDAVTYGTSKVEDNSIVYKGGIVKDTHVLNDSSVSYESTVINSIIQEARVQSSTLKDSSVFSSKIGQSDIEDSSVVFSDIGDTNMKHSFIESSTSTYGSVFVDSHIENETLKEENLVSYDSRVPKLDLSDNDLEDLQTLEEELNL